MSIKFNADEIFEIAEQIERNGAKFYRKAAEGFDDEELKKLILDLADMEDDHEKIFAHMRQEFSELENEPIDPGPGNEANLYLHAIAAGEVFGVQSDPSEILTGTETIGDVIEKALDLEKDSIVYYTGMKEMVPQTWGKDKLEKIIEEELRHIGILVNIRRRFGV